MAKVGTCGRPAVVFGLFHDSGADGVEFDVTEGSGPVSVFDKLSASIKKRRRKDISRLSRT
jgi:hypothetical protein